MYSAEYPHWDLLVCMFPSINAEQRAELSDDRVLVRVRLDGNLASLGILHQPCPTRSLNAGQSRVELLFQRVEAAVAVVDGFGKSARGRLAAALGGGR